MISGQHRDIFPPSLSLFFPLPLTCSLLLVHTSIYIPITKSTAPNLDPQHQDPPLSAFHVRRTFEYRRARVVRSRGRRRSAVAISHTAARHLLAAATADNLPHPYCTFLPTSTNNVSGRTLRCRRAPSARLASVSPDPLAATKSYLGDLGFPSGAASTP